MTKRANTRLVDGIYTPTKYIGARYSRGGKFFVNTVVLSLLSAFGFVNFNILSQNVVSQSTGDATVSAVSISSIDFSQPIPISPVELQTASKPTKITIPSIKLDSAVVAVGLTKAQKMAMPDDPMKVGWFDKGATPGSNGSAVMTGHYDTIWGTGGVFKNLKKMTVGDNIFVAGEDGKILRFWVTDIESYQFDQVPLDRVFDQSGSAKLNLITCSGSWNFKKLTYDKRLVVYAELAK